MQELISKITEKAGISAEQATKALDTIKEFVKEKFPMMAGAVDNLLSGDAGAATATTTTVTTTVTETSILDKISDVIPGQAGQKVEDFAKSAAHKAEDVFDDVKEKLSGMFGGEKN
jgi:hypothetical protein